MSKAILMPFLLAMLALTSLNACNTMGGFGEDVQDTGEYIEDEADDDSAE